MSNSPSTWAPQFNKRGEPITSKDDKVTVSKVETAKMDTKNSIEHKCDATPRVTHHALTALSYLLARLPAARGLSTLIPALLEFRYEVTSSCVDQGDGTYLLHWRSKGAGLIDVKVTINGQHVRGSPMKIELISTVPDLPKTILEGDGLTLAVAGKPTPIFIKLKDQYGNPSTPGSSWGVGIAITNSKKKVRAYICCCLYQLVSSL